MAIPKTLKPVDAAKARALIEKHTKAGTGRWEGAPEISDFVYRTKSGERLLRKIWDGVWETGKVSM